METCEPCQDGNIAALSGTFHVPRGCLALRPAGSFQRFIAVAGCFCFRNSPARGLAWKAVKDPFLMMDERQTGLTGLPAFMTAFMAGLLLTVPRKTVPRKTVRRCRYQGDRYTGGSGSLRLHSLSQKLSRQPDPRGKRILRRSRNDPRRPRCIVLHGGACHFGDKGKRDRILCGLQSGVHLLSEPPDIKACGPAKQLFSQPPRGVFCLSAHIACSGQFFSLSHRDLS